MNFQRLVGYLEHVARLSKKPLPLMAATTMGLSITGKRTSCSDQREQDRYSKAEWFEEARRAMPWKSVAKETSSSTVDVNVIDFGSGYTRANCVSLSPDGSASSKRVEGLSAPALQKALRDPKLQQKLINDIAEAIPTGRILAGATGGVRYALHSGSISHKQVDMFGRALAARLGSRARFDILTGEQEAVSEWRSIELALRTMEQMQVPGAVKVESFCGMLSAGGASCQLSFRRPGDVTKWRFLSFDNYISDPEGPLNGLYGYSESPSKVLPSTAEFAASLPAFESRVRNSVTAANVCGLTGTFASIELFYHMGVRGPPLGLGFEPYQEVRASDILAAIGRRVQNLLAKEEPPTRREAVYILTMLVAKVILSEMFDDSACLYFITGRDTNWSIGWALEQQGIVSKL